MTLKRKILLFSIIFMLMGVFGGCATLGAAGNLFAAGLAGLIKLPFHIVEKILDIVNMLPKPPPGVF